MISVSDLDFGRRSLFLFGIACQHYTRHGYKNDMFYNAHGRYLEIFTGKLCTALRYRAVVFFGIGVEAETERQGNVWELRPYMGH